MQYISVISALTVSISEAITISLLGIVSIGKYKYLSQKSNYIKILLYSIIFAALILSIRTKVGTELEVFVTGIILTGLLNIFILRLKFYESIMASIFGFVILAIVQTIYVLLITTVTGTTYDSIQNDNLFKVLVVLPERLIEIVLIFVALKKKINIINLEVTNIKKKEYYLQLFVYLIAIGTLLFLAIIMVKMILVDNGNLTSPTNAILIRLNIFLLLFVTIVLTLAITNVSEHYRNKYTLNNNEFKQSLDYIQKLLNENNVKEAKDAVNSLKTYIDSH